MEVRKQVKIILQKEIVSIPHYKFYKVDPFIIGLLGCVFRYNIEFNQENLNIVLEEIENFLGNGCEIEWETDEAYQKWQSLWNIEEAKKFI